MRNANKLSRKSPNAPTTWLLRAALLPLPSVPPRPISTPATPWLPSKMLCAYQTLLAKYKTPKCKTQNANANAKARAGAKASADSCAIQSCCLCQVASSSSLSLWHLSIYLIVDFCRTSTNDFLAKFVFRAQFMRLACHSAVPVPQTWPQ